MSTKRNINFMLAVTAAYYLFLRPQLLKWGTRLGESQRRLPGDDIIPLPNEMMTHAANIDAPPEAVWPWLAQMGRERTGYYSIDLIDNQGIPSVSYLRQDIPNPEVGMEMDGGLHIMELEPNRKLLFGGFSLPKPPSITYDLTMLYLLERKQDGSTRLLIRRRAFNYGLLGMIHSYNPFREMLRFASLRQQVDHLTAYATSMAHIKTAT